MGAGAWRSITGLLVLLAAGCAPRQIVQFHQLDRATAIELRERASEGDAAQEETRIVIDEPKRIERIVAVVNAHKDKWRKVEEELPPARYRIVFRDHGIQTETFELDEGRLTAVVGEGDRRSRELSRAEMRSLWDAFQFTANFKSP
jgi:stress response protein SCP2